MSKPDNADPMRDSEMVESCIGFIRHMVTRYAGRTTFWSVPVAQELLRIAAERLAAGMAVVPGERDNIASVMFHAALDYVNQLPPEKRTFPKG